MYLQFLSTQRIIDTLYTVNIHLLKNTKSNKLIKKSYVRNMYCTILDTYNHKATLMFYKCLYVRKYEGLDSLKRFILIPKHRNVSLATLCLNDPRIII